MLSIVPGGHNGNTKNSDKNVLKVWRITVDNGDVYLVKGTEVYVGDEGESLVVYNRETIVFSEKTHVNVSIDDKEWVTKEARPVKKRAVSKVKAPAKKKSKV